MKFSTFIILACAFCLFSSTNAVSSRKNRRPVWGLPDFLGNPEEFGEVPTLNRTEGEFQAENGDSNITVEANATIADEGNFEEIDQIHFPPWFRPEFLRRHRRHHRHEEAPEEILGDFNDIIEVVENETFVEGDYAEGNIPAFARYPPEGFEVYVEGSYGGINGTFGNATLPFPGPTNFPHFPEGYPGELSRGRNGPLRNQPTPFPGATNFPHFPEGEEFYGGINGTLPFPGAINFPHFPEGEEFYGGINEPSRNQPTPFPGPTNFPHFPEGYAGELSRGRNGPLRNQPTPFPGPTNFPHFPEGGEFYGGRNATLPFPGATNFPHFPEGEEFYGGINATLPFPGATNFPHFPEGEEFYGRLNDTLGNSTAPFFEGVEATPTSA